MKIYDIEPKSELINSNDNLLNKKPVRYLKSKKEKVLCNNDTSKKLVSAETDPNSELIDKASANLRNEDKNFQKKSDYEFLYENGVFSGVKFAHYLRSEGSQILYNHDIPDRQELPYYYDPIKFKRAVNVFEKYKFNMLLTQLSGLLILLIDSVGTKVLLMTNKASDKKAASIRYRNTLKHVFTWLNTDFSENSKFWKSIDRVRYLHYAANAKASQMYNMPQITQLELAGAMFAFFASAIVIPEHVGMQDITNEEQEALLHYGRVLGYILGVEDRFNVCRESVEEAKEALVALIEIHMKPRLELKDQDSLDLQFAAIQGVAQFTFPIFSKSFLNFTYEMLYPDRKERKKVEFTLNPVERVYLLGMKILIYFLRFTLFRRIMNKIITYVLV